MSQLPEVWQFWYEAQLKEQNYNKQTRSNVSNEKPSLKPARPFDPENDADVLRKAMKGLGTNEDDIIRILTRRTLSQRMEIQAKYQQIHGRDLVEDLKSELNGVFEKVIMSLLKPLSLFFAEQIKHSSKGVGTDEDALIEILCTRDDESLKTIMEAFEKEYDITLEEVVCNETSGHLQKLLMSILAMSRNDAGASPSEVADELVSEDVDEDTIRRIVTAYTLKFLERVFKEYQDKTGEEFTQLIHNKCSEDLRKAFEAIYLVSKSRSEYFAHALHNAIAGMGTDDWAMIRIIVSRCEIDLETIKEKYSKLFEKDLVEEVKKEISGDYETALVSLLGGDDE